jgi:hypothetical protein
MLQTIISVDGKERGLCQELLLLLLVRVDKQLVGMLRQCRPSPLGALSVTFVITQ